MKILVFSQYFYPETFRVNSLCKELVRRGHEVMALTAYPQYPQGKIYDGYGFDVPYQKQWEGVRVERLRVYPRGKSPLGLLRNCWSYVKEGYRWVKRSEERFDAVYVLGNSPVTVGLPAVAYGKKFSVPVLFNVQDLWPENIEVVLGIRNRLVLGVIDRMVDNIYAGSTKILCSSRSFVKNIANRGVPAEKLVYWPQFCEMPKLENTEKPAVYSDEYFNIVFAGNIGDAQGLDLLIDAAAELRDKPVRWFLVGDGRARQRLEEKVANAGLSEQVRFLGRVSESEANVFVHYADAAFLSFMDNLVFNMTIPAKLQTYLACGTPILASVGGECETIIQEANCGVVTEKDPKALSAGALSLMEQTPAERQRMRTLAKTYFDEHFAMDMLVDELEAHMGQGAAK